MYLKKRDELNKIINLKKRDVVTLVGSHGKTTFCLNLCDELKKNNENIIFFSTTTKIYEVDTKYDFKFQCFIENEVNNNEETLEKYENKILNNLYGKGVYVFGIKKEKKINSLPLNLLEKLYNESKIKCDYLILEGDGSKEKPLKGWNLTEPVYISQTTKSIGIIPINIVGEIINEKNIHRMEKFLNISKGKLNDKITVEMLYNVITHENGLFQYGKGEKILVINCIENEENKKNSIKLYKLLIKNNNNLKIIGASLKNKKYYEIKDST